MSVYDLSIRRADQFWLVFVDGISGLTQARTFAEVPVMAREYVALVTGQPPDAITIGEVHVQEISDDVARVKELRIQAKTARAEATDLSRQIAAKLYAKQIPMVEIGGILELSHQRIAQLLAKNA